MGLESVIFLFKGKDRLQQRLSNIGNIYMQGENKYIYKDSSTYFIDLLLQTDYLLSIRIALCNPYPDILNAFFILVKKIFKEGDHLFVYDIKLDIDELNQISLNFIKDFYDQRRTDFIKNYSNISVPISADDFFDYIDHLNSSK